jgi:hypothetical protein
MDIYIPFFSPFVTKKIPVTPHFSGSWLVFWQLRIVSLEGTEIIGAVERCYSNEREFKLPPTGNLGILSVLYARYKKRLFIIEVSNIRIVTLWNRFLVMPSGPLGK